jgi:hypothetical protein
MRKFQTYRFSLGQTAVDLTYERVDGILRCEI